MAYFDWEKYPTVEEASSKSEEATPSFDWNKYPEAPPLKEESLFSQIGRTLYQPLAGVAQRFTYPLNLIQAIGVGDALAELEELEERLPELRKKFPGANLPENIDREKYLASLQSASEYFPTQQNIERGIENLTGLPLTPENTAQELLRMSGTAAAFRPGDAAQKATAAVAAPAAKLGLEASGVPEPIAEALGYVAGGISPTPSFAKQIKPSGLTQRGFEGITKSTKVSPYRHQKISESLEKDFRSISDKMMKNSSQTFSKMKENPFFKDEVIKDLKEVQRLSTDISGEVKGSQLKSSFKSRFESKPMEGISLSEYERSFLKESNKLHRGIDSKNSFSASELVKQFRKNNESFREIFEPGLSGAKNRAKAEALLEYNRTIASIIDNKYPESDFAKLFNQTNKLYSEIMDIEKTQSFIDEIFDGKIDFSKAEKFMESKRLTKSFKNVLGKEGYKDFTGLMKEFLGAKQGYNLLKKAEALGFKDLAKHGAAWFISPTFGKLKGVWDIGKFAKNALLDKPKLILKWRSALNEFKSGNFVEADRLVKELEKSS